MYRLMLGLGGNMESPRMYVGLMMIVREAELGIGDGTRDGGCFCMGRRI